LKKIILLASSVMKLVRCSKIKIKIKLNFFRVVSTEHWMQEGLFFSKKS